MSYPLGSFIPNPVLADIVSFLTDEEICQFNLASPRAHAIVKTYKLMKNDFNTIRFGWIEKPTEIRILKVIGEKDFFLRILEPNDEIERKQMITILLTKCRSLNEIDMWYQSIDKFFMELLMKSSPKKIMISETKIDVSPQLLLAFVRKFPRAVNFSKIEISNKLLDEEIFLLSKNTGFFRSWKSDCQNIESRVVNVTDATLEEMMRRSKAAIPKFLTQIDLCGFLTGFTVEGVNSYAKECSSYTDFGILGCDQIAEAVALTNSYEVEVSYTEPIYTFFDDDRVWPGVKFAVSLNETISGPVSEDSLPVEGVPEQGLRIFDKIVKVLNTAEDIEFDAAEKLDINSVEFVLETDKYHGYKMKIGIHDNKFGYASVVFVRTDITLVDVYCIVVKFFKMCRSILLIKWDGITLNEQFYEKLKPFADTVDVQRPWGIRMEINEESLLNILRASGGLFGQLYLSQNYFQEKVLSNESDGTGGYSNPLTDYLLLILAGKVNVLQSFSLKIYTSMFTAEGIKSFMEALDAHTGHKSFRYHLGKIHESNQAVVEEMIAEIEADESGSWKGKKEEKENICSVTIEKVKTAGLRKWQTPKTVFTLCFDLAAEKV